MIGCLGPPNPCCSRPAAIGRSVRLPVTCPFRVGGAGSDTLTRGSGDDRLLGGAGDDLLDGGEGFDRLFGELGIDTGVNGEVRIGIMKTTP